MRNIIICCHSANTLDQVDITEPNVTVRHYSLLSTGLTRDSYREGGALGFIQGGGSPGIHTGRGEPWDSYREGEALGFIQGGGSPGIHTGRGEPWDSYREGGALGFIQGGGESWD